MKRKSRFQPWAIRFVVGLLATVLMKDPVVRAGEKDAEAPQAVPQVEVPRTEQAAKLAEDLLSTLHQRYRRSCDGVAGIDATFKVTRNRRAAGKLSATWRAAISEFEVSLVGNFGPQGPKTLEPVLQLGLGEALAGSVRTGMLPARARGLPRQGVYAMALGDGYVIDRSELLRSAGSDTRTHWMRISKDLRRLLVGTSPQSSWAYDFFEIAGEEAQDQLRVATLRHVGYRFGEPLTTHLYRFEYSIPPRTQGVPFVQTMTCTLTRGVDQETLSATLEDVVFRRWAPPPPR